MSLGKDPVALMRLVEVDSAGFLQEAMGRAGLGPGDLIVETKFNGWLSQAAGGRLYSRRGEELTSKFPHIAKLIAPFQKEHLIGELVYFNEHGIMDEPSVTRVAGTADPREAVRKLRAMPGHFDYVVFDIIAVNGEDISQAPMETRRQILNDCLCESGLTVSNPLPFSRLQEVFEAGVAAGGDGVVIKNLHAPYIWKPLGQSEARPYATWWKLKPSFMDDFVVVRSKRGPKGKLVVTLAQFHQGELVEVGDMNNFSSPIEGEVLERLKEGPFVVEVEYTSRFPDPPGALQHPRFVRFRPDKPMESVLLPKRYAPEGPTLGDSANLHSSSLGAVEGWVVTRDGETLKTGFASENEAFKWIHDNTSQSWDRAIRYEGYDVVLVRGGRVEYSAKQEQIKERKKRSPEELAEEFEQAVRQAFTDVFGEPKKPETKERAIRSSYLETGRKQGWTDPRHNVVLVGTEYGWFDDMFGSGPDWNHWENVADLLKARGWRNAWFDSINPAVHVVYWEPE